MPPDDALMKEMFENLVELKVGIGEIKGDIRGINQTLNGNGNKGLCERIEIIEEKSGKFHDFVLTFKAWIAGATAVASLVATVTVLIINKFWRH